MADDNLGKEVNPSADMGGAFESVKIVRLMNCNDFYVRMFNNSGAKRFAKVSTLPGNGCWHNIKTKHDEFSLYNRKGGEQCVIIFPRERYLANKNIDESNQDNLFDVLWTSDLECRVTYMKKPLNVWPYVLIAMAGLFLLFL